MKIAFVNQPFDVILPPFQNSVGACSYGPACSLAPGHQVTVFGMLQPKQQEPEVSHRNVRFRFLPSSQTDHLFSTLWKIRSKLAPGSAPLSTSALLYPNYGRRVALELSKEPFDVIHIQHSSQYVPVIRRLNPKAKIVLHLHAEWFSQCSPAQLANRLKGLDLLTTVSNHITRKVMQQVPELAGRCETTYNGINDDEFSEARSFAPHDGVKRIMYAGGVSPHKGLHVLLEAFRLVVARDPSVHLDIVGPQGTYPLAETFDLEDRSTIESIRQFYPQDGVAGSLRRRLHGLSSDSYLDYLKSLATGPLANKVNFLGIIPRPELLRRYYGADVFVFPPIWDEGFGIPPVEAMGAGAAVVASRSGAVVETVVHGETGLLVEKNNPQALANAILALLANAELRTTLGAAGRTRVLENFTWSHVAQQMERRYQLLCSSQPAPQTQPVSQQNVLA